MVESSSVTRNGLGSGMTKLAANVGVSSNCPDCEIFRRSTSGVITSARNFSSPTPSSIPWVVFSTKTTSPRGMNRAFFIYPGRDPTPCECTASTSQLRIGFLSAAGLYGDVRYEHESNEIVVRLQRLPEHTHA